MRVNEYKTLEDFINEYIGIWNPSEGHWFGLDFKYDGAIYRLHTGSMYHRVNTVLPNGRTALFGIYKLSGVTGTDYNYTLLEEYADMSDLLDSEVICGRKFKDIIMDDATEILGKD